MQILRNAGFMCDQQKSVKHVRSGVPYPLLILKIMHLIQITLFL